MNRNLAAAWLLLLAALPATAKNLPAATGPVVLTILGGNVHKNTETGVEFDMEMLRALPQTIIETTTPWHDGIMRFEGPLLSVLMERVEAKAEIAEVIALDGYSYDIPLSDFGIDGPILAILRNGEFMPDDDQGPLFVIYDYDSDPALDTEEFHSKSVWSVEQIELR